MPGIFRTAVALTAFLACLGAAGGETFVDYDFDEGHVETGPWLHVFENAKGRVTLTSAYRLSGYHSVEITDVAGDGDFPELQGFLPLIERGRVFVHFAFMTAEPFEELNIAFAGPAHFFLRDNGMGFWLQARAGTLRQMNARRWTELFQLQAFTWYVVDVTFDIDTGNYSLRIREEGREEPIVALDDLPNAIGMPGSQLRKYSFIGAEPGHDDSNVVFYVDDIRVGADGSGDLGPFVAPGRRMLFVDLYDYYARRFHERPGCPPVLGPSDFGLTDEDLHELSASGHLPLFETLADGAAVEAPLPDDLPSYLSIALVAMQSWAVGCAETEDRDRHFASSANAVPDAKIYAMSQVLARVSERRWREADELFAAIYPDWQSDPRFPAISATIGIARGDLDEAERWLLGTPDRLPAELRHPSVRALLSGEMHRGLVEELKSVYPEAWSGYVESALMLEQRYYVLLWQRDYVAAGEYAGRVARRFVQAGLPEARWLEREGDAAFYAGRYDDALALYEASREIRRDERSILLKLSDVHFKLGNVELERVYRERIYGSLERKDDAGAREPRVRQCVPGPS